MSRPGRAGLTPRTPEGKDTALRRRGFDPTEGTPSVFLERPVDRDRVLNAYALIDLQETGVVVHDGTTRWFVPWSNVRAISQEVGSVDVSTIIQGTQLRQVLLGTRVEKATGALTAATVPLFTVAGGKVLITSIIGEVTTAITVANSYKLQHNPTTGTVTDLVAATDIGTTDTPAGNLLGFTGVKADSIIHGPGSAPTLAKPLILTAGQIEHVSAGTDGAITWVLTYIPLDDGASVVAA